MPYVKKGPQTEIGEKIEELAGRLPYKEWYLPDPYSVGSYLHPMGMMPSGYSKALIQPFFQGKLSQEAKEQIVDALRVSAKIPKRVTKELGEFSAFKPFPAFLRKERTVPFREAGGVTGYYWHPERFIHTSKIFDPAKITVHAIEEPTGHTLAGVVGHEGGHGISERLLTKMGKMPAADQPLYKAIWRDEWEGIAEYLGHELQKSANLKKIAPPDFSYGEFQRKAFEELSQMPSKNPYMNVYRYLQRLQNAPKANPLDRMIERWFK